MTLADLTQHAGEWLRGAGPMHDVVISSRVRLARNLAGTPFLSRCPREQQAELEQKMRQEILSAELAKGIFYVDVAAAGDLDRELLVERHLVSRQHAEASHPRGVAVSGDETISIMVNEEDHLRMQVLRSGLQLPEAVADANRIDDAMERCFDFAFHSRYGYLTACPTNVGTGLRLSVMLHLPGLKLAGEMDKAFRAAGDMRLAIRGLYGEGTEASGDFFQISNQTTLGRSENQYAEEFSERLIPAFIEYERRARKHLMDEQNALLEDKVSRAVATLRSAKMISSEETMSLLSVMRLGTNLGLTDDMDLSAINELFLLTQPAHLQKIHRRDMTPQERAQCRADMIRRRLDAG